MAKVFICRLLCCVVFIGPISGAMVAVGDEDQAAWEQWGKGYEEKILPIIRAKCLQCHQGESPDGEFDLSKFPDGTSAVAALDTWERVARRVRLNEMPPQGSPGLTDPEKGAFHRWADSRPNQDLCHQLASDETQSWYRGHVMSRRLTRYEYARALRDLTGFEADDLALPPSDGAGGLGFDTVGDALFTSPIHLEAYLRAATSAIARVYDSAPALTPESLNLVLQDRQAALSFSFVQEEQDTEPKSAELEAARRTIAAFARRAWRRPVLPEEIERLMQLHQREVVNAEKHWLQALRAPLQAILVSPNFLFLVEPEPQTAGVQRLNQHQFATRIALLLWSSVPDEELLELADRGELFDESIIRLQIQRMLGDRRSRALGENFGLQWLSLRDWRSIQLDPSVFPEFSSDLMEDSIEETILTIASVFREGRPPTELLSSETVWVNARLAKHYELNNADVVGWQKLPVGNSKRGGVLTMASVLMKSSFPRRTSPVLRGRWILEDVLGDKVPPPPPNVPTLDEYKDTASAGTLRERLELHRTQPDCASCHQRMDPLGFALENFDALGRFRMDDDGNPIDAKGILPSGEAFDGPNELKETLMRRHEEFQKHFVRKLVGYALGRDLNKFDQCVIDRSFDRLKEGAGADAILEEIISSYPFQHRYYNPARSSP
jgi:hypothetical protein